MVDADSTRASTESRQKAIADAARALIAERGFEGLRTRDIADRVGINVATLHYHVPSKQALVRLVAHSLRAEFTEQHMRRPRKDLSPRECLEAEFGDHRDLMIVRPDLLLVLAELSERARRDPEVAAEMDPMRAYWHDQIASILERGRADGSFRADLDPVAGATLVIGAMTGARRFQALSDTHFDAVCAEILRAVANPDESSRHE